jgi:hypothetical protein
MFGIIGVSTFVFSIHWFQSLLLAFFSILLFYIFLVFYRRKEYYKFIKNIGASISSETFYDCEYVMAAIPFQKIVVACSARIEGDNILFGRSPVFRSVNIESINDIEVTSFAGHSVAKLTLLNNSDAESTMFIPWSSLLEESVEFCST